MSRENAAAKGRRYIAEGRLILRRLDEADGFCEADCRGSGAVWICGRDERGWFCNCPARGLCAHVEALRLVVALEPREAR
ncbi:MAG: hypothetical protein M3R70_06290 [Actinomycetota bacterium]|nr:hypothetical protein [Actinomycetota bacterium]